MKSSSLTYFESGKTAAATKKMEVTHCPRVTWRPRAVMCSLSPDQACVGVEPTDPDPDHRYKPVDQGSEQHSLVVGSRRMPANHGFSS